jgi:hypothetical protein
MQKTYQRPTHLTKLHDAILAALPHLAAFTDGQPLLRVEGDPDGQWVTLEFPPADEAALDQLLAAHDPTPPAPPLDPDDALADALESATTLVEFKGRFIANLRERALKRRSASVRPQRPQRPQRPSRPPRRRPR